MNAGAVGASIRIWLCSNNACRWVSSNANNTDMAAATTLVKTNMRMHDGVALKGWMVVMVSPQTHRC
jgi:hypothetical protein